MGVEALAIAVILILGSVPVWATLVTGLSNIRILYRALQDASRELELQTRAPSFFSRTIEGRSGPFEFSVESVAISREPNSQGSAPVVVRGRPLLLGGRQDDRDIGARITVSGGRIPARLVLRPQSGTTRLSEDVPIGDAFFDNAVEVRGEPALALALLDKTMRPRIFDLAEAGGLEGGRISWTCRMGLPCSAIVQALASLLALARDLASTEGGPIWQRLARNAREDSQAGVRLRNLQVLQQEFASTSEAREASLAGLADKSPWVRLAGARFLPEPGLGVLESLIQDRSVPERAAAEALGLFASRAGAERAAPLLVAVLKARTGELRRRAVEELGRLKHRPALGPLAVLLETAEPRTAALAAAALAALGDEKAEPALLDATKGGPREIRLAAARALGAVGGVRSVAPLLAVLEAGPADAEVRGALRDAVRAIQSRLVGAEAGQLSVAEARVQDGRLSLATAVPGPGDLSLAPRDGDPPRRSG